MVIVTHMYDDDPVRVFTLLFSNRGRHNNRFLLDTVRNIELPKVKAGTALLLNLYCCSTQCTNHRRIVIHVPHRHFPSTPSRGKIPSLRNEIILLFAPQRYFGVLRNSPFTAKTDKIHSARTSQFDDSKFYRTADEVSQQQ